MHHTAEHLIRELELKPHPEGGHYAEVHRSAAMTSIYFLLASGEISRWHRIHSDETWHFYDGAPLDLLQLSPDGSELEHVVLGTAGGTQTRLHCVPGRHWQAARSRGHYTLVGCTVAPPFEFAQFALLKDFSALASAIVRKHPAAAQFV